MEINSDTREWEIMTSQVEIGFPFITMRSSRRDEVAPGQRRDRGAGLYSAGKPLESVIDYPIVRSILPYTYSNGTGQSSLLYHGTCHDGRKQRTNLFT